MRISIWASLLIGWRTNFLPLLRRRSSLWGKCSDNRLMIGGANFGSALYSVGELINVGTGFGSLCLEFSAPVRSLASNRWHQVIPIYGASFLSADVGILIQTDPKYLCTKYLIYSSLNSHIFLSLFPRLSQSCIVRFRLHRYNCYLLSIFPATPLLVWVSMQAFSGTLCLFWPARELLCNFWFSRPITAAQNSILDW